MRDYQLWDGRSLDSNKLGLALVDADQSPWLVFSSSTGQSVQIPPEQLGMFLRRHSDVQIVCSDAARVHRLLKSELEKCCDTEAVSCLWGFSQNGRLHDIQILDRLVRLAEHSGCRSSRSVVEIANDHGFQINSPPDNLTFASCLLDLYASLAGQAAEVITRMKIDTVPNRFGPLGMRLEVQSAIAFDSMSQRGFQLDSGMREAIINRCETERTRAISALRQEREFRGVFLLDGSEVRIKQERPMFKEDKLRAALEELTIPLRMIHNARVPVPLDQQGETSTDPNRWRGIAILHRLLGAWSKLMFTCEVLRAVQQSQDDRIHPTCIAWPEFAARPDLETAGELGLFECIVPSVDNKLFLVEFNNLELAALGTHLARNHGPSLIADDLRNKTPPHLRLAPRLNGVDECDFAQLASRDRARFDHHVSLAQCLLDTVPLGVGPMGLREILHVEFGLSLTDSESHHRITLQSFPCLQRYLTDGVDESVGERDLLNPLGQVIGRACQWERLAVHRSLANAVRVAFLYSLESAGFRPVAAWRKNVLVEASKMRTANETCQELEGLFQHSASWIFCDVPVACSAREFEPSKSAAILCRNS